MLKGVCVGTGYFSQFHYEAWSRLSDAEIVGICDLDIDKAKHVTADFFKNPPHSRNNRDVVPPQYNSCLLYTSGEAVINFL